MKRAVESVALDPTPRKRARVLLLRPRPALPPGVTARLTLDLEVGGGLWPRPPRLEVAPGADPAAVVGALRRRLSRLAEAHGLLEGLAEAAKRRGAL